MPGGLIQLSAYGSENQYINGNPQITFFKSVYKRYTNFSLENIEVPLSGPDELAWDMPIKLKTKIPRNADLISNMYLRLDLPPIFSTEEMNFAWSKDLGFVLIDYVDLYIGGQKIQRLTGNFANIQFQLEHSQEKKHAIKRLIGGDSFLSYDAVYPGGYPGFNSTNEYQDSSGKTIKNKFFQTAPAIFKRALFIPLDFWFTKDPGLSLPLIALQYHDIEIEIQLRSARELYTVLEVDKTYYYYGSNKHYNSGSGMESIVHRRNGNPNGWNGIMPIKDVDIRSFTTYRRVKPDVMKKTHHISNFVRGSYDSKTWSLNPVLDIKYVFLDECERKNFAQTSHQYLIQQVNKISFDGNIGSTNHLLELYHPVKEIIFETYRDDNIERNEWSNTSNYQYNTGYDIYEYQTSYWFDAIENENKSIGRFNPLSDENTPTIDDRFQEFIFRYGPHGESCDPSCPLGFNINSELLTLEQIMHFKDIWKFEKAAYIPKIDSLNYEQYHTHCINGGFIKFNGNYRQQERVVEYWDSVQAYQYHTSIPNEGIYSYSFSFFPEKFQPSGACNMSRLKNVEFNIEYKIPPLNNSEIRYGNRKYKWMYNTNFFVVNYNILNLTGGMGGLVFGN